MHLITEINDMIARNGFLLGPLLTRFGLSRVFFYRVVSGEYAYRLRPKTIEKLNELRSFLAYVSEFQYAERGCK